MDEIACYMEFGQFYLLDFFSPPPNDSPLPFRFGHLQHCVFLFWRNKRKRTVELQVIALGEAALVGASGELFAALDLHIKAQSPFHFTFFVGYAKRLQRLFGYARLVAVGRL